jgi:carboxypeptidase C (cathepsin A)
MTQNNKDEKKESEKLPPPPHHEETLSETSHSVTIDGVEIKYTATAGRIVLTEEEGKKQASFFFVAYSRTNTPDMTQRPLTFSFNGGPGSSSVWLHLGVLGPRRVLMDDLGNPLPPPGRVVENAYSLLDVTDLVFIDPVSTGFSRAIPEEEAKKFHNFKHDIETVGEFIRLYTTRFKRWGSPKFLIGESYGTTRAAGLSGYLQDRHAMFLNGVMLISSILNFQTARFTPGNDMPYILFLPTYTASAWYHKQLDDDLQADLQATLAEVKAFAQTEYTLALMQGAALSAESRATIVQKLARFTGLSETYIDRADLRINIMGFVKELLREEGRTIGRLDSRFTGIDRNQNGAFMEHDPSMDNIMGPYTAAMNDYVRRDLAYESDLPYEILTPRVQPWNYEAFQNEFVDVAHTLSRAIAKNPYLKVYVANGYYDLATPYFATEYTFNHMGLDKSLHENISMGYFEAGHMMYIHMPSLAQLREELVAFIGSAVGK